MLNYVEIVAGFARLLRLDGQNVRVVSLVDADGGSAFAVF